MSYIKNKASKDGLRYHPKNKDKYKGSYPIWCRSTGEYQFCQGADNNDSIISGASEPIHIPYQNPIKQREARYYPDYLVKCKTKNGDTKIYLIEIKPYKECKPPVNSGKKTKKTLLYEQKTGKENKAKGQAANKYCKLKGGTFKIITEKELFRE